MKFKFNNIIKYLVLSDLIFYTGWGLITPIFAIFIVNNIQGGTILIAGIASSIYWILRSVLRVPIGVFLDNRKGEKGDYFFLVIGFFIVSLVPFGYLISKFPWHIYGLQAIYGIGMAMAGSGWSAIFTKHIDKGKEATEWGLDSTSYGIGMGLAAIIGGGAVTKFGFNPVFIAVGIIGLLGVVILLCIRKNIKGVFDGVHPFSLKRIFNGERK